MLHIWMEQNVLFYGMIGAGILGILCMFMVDRFYGRAIRDVRRITEPKGKWTKEFLNQYQMRLTKEQEINNPEAFVRTQLARGKTLGIGIQKWKQGIRLQRGSVLPFDSDGSLWDLSAMSRHSCCVTSMY